MDHSTCTEGRVSDDIETLRRERDRFVALAFCAADLLLEVDSGHIITFAAGAAGATRALVGQTPEELTGNGLRGFIAPEDRALVDELMRGMAPASRLDPFKNSRSVTIAPMKDSE